MRFEGYHLMETHVSIVVLTHDRPEFLRRCVESVEKFTSTPYRWVFVLNGVQRETLDYVKGTGMAEAVLDLPWNRGVTPGRIEGMKASAGDLILFLDDDAFVVSMPDLDWLGRLAQHFRDPKVGVVAQGGSYINPSQPGVFWACHTAGAECDVGQGYCFMFRKSLIDEVGHLDWNFGLFWHEESDYALTVKEHGYKVINAGYVGVEHAGRGSGDDGTYDLKIRYLFEKHRRNFDRILVPRSEWK